ncbi:phage Gp37/Gp68 family protein [Leptospira noguchii]|uniref:phage Gp37/Gp68 family protein n=1 Tax=Leptospira noguchii TaxID=28182 RepID=UPI001FB77291|nr:phage Gp37/Gp68 family protein [Leptospira noguchii]UOG33079.1 phage Gp37/Gp68 family protein [Leptospira noguchii]UOG43893.1 phage Gp37/Gp68 family protein [Leptospira noguchii]
MNYTKIEWTDSTWNPTTGCSKISNGCKNCYAESLTKRFEKMWGQFSEIKLHSNRLDFPRKVKGKRIFVDSMSDLFHKDVPFDFIDKVHTVITECPENIFQILTKRIDRAKKYYDSRRHFDLKNVWFGTSIENQNVVEERIRHLIQIPSNIRFLSCEPLLEKVDVSIYLNAWRYIDCFPIDWVIVGGESGPGARPIQIEWVRFIRDQCNNARVPFFFKQWGGRKKKEFGRELDGREWNEFPKEVVI